MLPPLNAVNLIQYCREQLIEKHRLPLAIADEIVMAAQATTRGQLFNWARKLSGRETTKKEWSLFDCKVIGQQLGYIPPDRDPLCFPIKRLRLYRMKHDRKHHVL